MADTTVYFATNRRPNDADNPTDFTEDIVGDGDSVRFGKALLAGTGLFRKDLDKLTGDVRIEVTPERLHPDNAALSTLGSTAIFGEIAAAMRAGNCDALFYVHGYDYTFRESVARAAQLKQWLGAKPLVMVMFAWPSLGRGVAPQTYKDERRRAEISGNAIARVILKATDFIRATRKDGSCGQQIHLLAHSMGAWAMRGAVQGMRTFVGDNIPPLLNEVVFAAGDEDDDALGKAHKLMPILRGCRRVTVYYNVQDVALKASDWAMGNPDRLGRSGPENRPGLPEKVVPVNVSPAIIYNAGEGRKYKAWEIDETGHQYYRNNGLVRDDLIQVLNGVETADIRKRKKREDYWRVG